MQDTQSRRTFSSKLWRLFIVALFFVATAAPAILLSIYFSSNWALLLLAVPVLWTLSPRALGSRLPDSLTPPMSGQRLPYAVLFAIVVLGTINLAGVNYMQDIKALLVVVGLTVAMLIFISLMSRLPRSNTDKFFDWLD